MKLILVQDYIFTSCTRMYIITLTTNETATSKNERHWDTKLNHNRTGDSTMKRVNAQQYKALTSYYNVKIISANDNTVLVRLIGKK